VEDGVLDAAWDSVLSMTGYSFCKPHSASYAQVSYQSAYLKAHYPAHFLAAVLSNGGGFYSTQAYVSEALRLGLRVYLPCVNRSAWAFTEDNGGIRVGFMAIQGLHRRSADAILAARADGPFRSLADCQQRTRLGFQELHRLAVIGALDSVAPTLNRPQILWMSKGMTKTDAARRGGAKAGPRAGDERGEASATGASLPSASTGPAAAPSPRSLFDSPAPQASLFAADAPPRQPPRLPPFTRRQRMETEYACLGFLVGAHPLALYDEQLRRLDIPVVSSRLLPQMRGRRVTLIGWPVTGKVVSTKHKEAMEFFSFEDAHGIYETVLFPKAYNRYGKLLQTVRPLLVTGTVQTEFGAVAVRVESVRPLSAPGGGAAGRAPPRRALTGGARGR
jgi:DNA polymerase III alpha subunit